jgi:AraC family transcriptional regulator
MQKIFIKGMVCNRCIATVQAELEKIGLQAETVTLGEVTLTTVAQISDYRFIETHLKKFGFSLLEDKKRKLVADVKRTIEEIYSGDFDFPQRFRFSLYISGKLHKDYDFISTTFSALEQQTLEYYIINYRIEKVKAFLTCPTQTIANIAFQLGFSSVAHLSRQFKAIAGYNPSWYRAIQEDKVKLRPFEKENFIHHNPDCVTTAATP